MPFPKTEAEFTKAGYKFLRESKCTGPTCNADLLWYLTPKLSRLPVDKDTLEPHFAKCPDVGRFRK